MLSHEVESLRLRIRRQESDLVELKRQLVAAEAKSSLEFNQNGISLSHVPDRDNASNEPDLAALTPQWPWPLTADEYRRYGRQMILPEIGLQGQGADVHATHHHWRLSGNH